MASESWWTSLLHSYVSDTIKEVSKLVEKRLNFKESKRKRTLASTIQNTQVRILGHQLSCVLSRTCRTSWSESSFLSLLRCLEAFAGDDNKCEYRLWPSSSVSAALVPWSQHYIVLFVCMFVRSMTSLQEKSCGLFAVFECKEKLTVIRKDCRIWYLLFNPFFKVFDVLLCW